MASPEPQAPEVVLDIPPKAEYVGLLRLALSAVARLASLNIEDTADLKLAVDEAARRWIPAAPAPGNPPPDGGEGRERLSVRYGLSPERLRLELRCAGPEVMRPAEHELSVTIIGATVDECRAEPGFTELVKYLGPEADSAVPERTF